MLLQGQDPSLLHSQIPALQFYLLTASWAQADTALLSYRMHGVQDLGELVKPPRAGGGVLPLASNDPIEFLNVVHAKFIKELLVLQAIHWNWRNRERKQSCSKCGKKKRATGEVKEWSVQSMEPCLAAPCSPGLLREGHEHSLILKKSRAFMQRNSWGVI